jgi:hypothetical protein
VWIVVRRKRVVLEYITPILVKRVTCQAQLWFRPMMWRSDALDRRDGYIARPCASGGNADIARSVLTASRSIRCRPWRAVIRLEPAVGANPAWLYTPVAGATAKLVGARAAAQLALLVVKSGTVGYGHGAASKGQNDMTIETPAPP